MARQPKGIGPRRKDENAYFKSVKREILDPLMARTMARLETVVQVRQAYVNAVNAEFALTTGAGDFGLGVVEKAMDTIRTTHKARMIKTFQSALGVDIGPFMSDLAIRPFMNQALMNNVDLISSIPKRLNLQIVEQFEQIFTEKGLDQQALQKVLKQRFKVASNRARLITRDQTEKIVGQLNQIRQTDLGIRSYIWQTSEDERVVGTPGGEYPVGNDVHGDHYSRNGKEFQWAVPPHDGHPGQPINCRCVAIPVIPELQAQENAA